MPFVILRAISAVFEDTRVICFELCAVHALYVFINNIIKHHCVLVIFSNMSVMYKVFQMVDNMGMTRCKSHGLIFICGSLGSFSYFLYRSPPELAICRINPCLSELD